MGSPAAAAGRMFNNKRISDMPAGKDNNSLYILRYTLVLIFLILCVPVQGQFTIPKGEAPKKVFGIGDSVRAVQIEAEEYYSPAREKARRLARRKERNLFQIDARFEISQTQFENWVAGSDNTFMMKATVDMTHKYTRSRFSFESRFNARYGMTYIEKKMFKNEDFFRLSNAALWSIHKNWAYSVTSELTSQFGVGVKSRTNNDKVSNFMSPGNWKPAVGLAFNKAPWSITISPVGGSATFMLDADLLEKDQDGNPNHRARAKWQVGSSLRVEYKKKMLKDVIELRSEAFGFTNYKRPPTARWETTCKICATKFIATTLFFKMLYDEATRVPHPDRIQYNYSIGVGLTYTFKNK